MPRSRIRRYLRHGMLPQLAVFEAVCRLGSYTRAAEELCIAQPTVSTQMKKLADTLGVPLVESNGKRFAMTDAGRELAAACQDIFLRLERVEERLVALRGLERGRLRVAASSAAKEFMTRLLGRFCARYPTIEVSLHIDNWQGMRTRLRENEDDLYVLLTVPSVVGPGPNSARVHVAMVSCKSFTFTAPLSTRPALNARCGRRAWPH
jgi:DNA-binding transcriptional LysR family regulator